MTPIVHAINEISATIPEEILQEVFGSKSNGKRRDITPVNIEYAIRQAVINGRVIKTLNLQSQRTMKIPYNKITFLTRSFDRSVIKVSKKDMAGCSIVTPMAVVYSDNQDTTGAGVGTTDTNYAQTSVEGRFQKISNGHANLPNMQTADLRMIAPNTVLVENFAYAANISLLCSVSHDAELMSLPNGYWGRFAELCQLATEAHIYLKLHIKIDRAKLSGGMELGSFKEIVDNYRDSEKMYKEALEKFKKYDNLANAKNRMRHAQAQGPSYIQ